MTEFVARVIVDAFETFVLPENEIDEVIVSGGGVHNDTLMGRIERGLHPIPVVTSDQYGLSADAKEAIAFAILANETISGRPANVPGVTGAGRPVVLGKIVPAGTRNSGYEGTVL